MKVKNLRVILGILKVILIVTIIVAIGPMNWMYVTGEGEVQATSEYTLMNDINYTETLEDITNPERGFYSTQGLKLKQSGNTASSIWSKLTHLRVSIGQYSSKNEGGADVEFTEDALQALGDTLGNARKFGGSVIIRFAYDDFNGKGDVEPPVDLIIKHISQLKPVFYANSDVIAYVELGFFGPWGEMHTSKICNAENFNKAIDAMLEATPESIKIATRTPGHFVNWAKDPMTSSINKEIERDKMNEYISEKGTPEYRVGIFNDGYLGTDYDLGTFINREVEIKWLEKQAMHTFYGGEVVANYNPEGTPAINTAEYMSTEAFRTHTTYLNSEWNLEVINAWKDEIYNGNDELYKGKTGYEYITNHLGYRFVLRKSELTNSIKENERLKIKLQIENVGFANLINEKKVTIVLKSNENTYEIPTNIDATTWNSTETSDVNIEVPLPENVELGEYNIYLRISQNGDIEKDNNYKCIRLANKGDTWEQNLGANYIGKVTISEKPEDPEPDTPDPEPEKPDPEPDTPDPEPDTPDPEPDTPDSEPDTPDPVPDTPDPKPDTPEKPTKPDIENSTGKTDGTTANTTIPKTGNNMETILISIFLIIIIDIMLSVIKMKF